jgi:hypothetical protein
MTEGVVGLGDASDRDALLDHGQEVLACGGVSGVVSTF